MAQSNKVELFLESDTSLFAANGVVAPLRFTQAADNSVNALAGNANAKLQIKPPTDWLITTPRDSECRRLEGSGRDTVTIQEKPCGELGSGVTIPRAKLRDVSRRV